MRATLPVTGEYKSASVLTDSTSREMVAAHSRSTRCESAVEEPRSSWRAIRSAEAPGPLAVRGTPSELAALTGQTVRSIRQRGKFLLIDLERDRIACNPMLTGRFQLARPGDKRPAKTAMVLAFGPRPGGPPRDVAAWTRRASWLPDPESTPEVRYRDPTQMGKIYLVPAGVERPVPGLADGELGPDADDPALTLEIWRERIRERFA